MHRRKFLKIAGTSSIIISAGAVGSGLYITSRTPVKAQQSWASAGTQYTDPMRNALSFAILAPNPHNRQPWVVDLKSDTQAVLFCDSQRLLPATDPYNRQIVIGLGCFLELFEMSARQMGYRAQINLFPDGVSPEHLDKRPIAQLTLIEDSNVNKDMLFLQILKRRTNRNAYDTSLSIQQSTLDEIVGSANKEVKTNGVVQGPLVKMLRTLSRDALRDEILDPVAFQESVDLMRIGRKEIQTQPDGISLSGAFFETLNLLGILTREKLADTNSSAFQVGLDGVDDQALTAMGFVWINTSGNTRMDQIAAGRSYMRIALSVTRLGLSMQPMSQALQEYTAMETHYRKIHTMLNLREGERIQMLARLGYTKDVQPSPRWALSTRIKHSNV